MKTKSNRVTRQKRKKTSTTNFQNISFPAAQLGAPQRTPQAKHILFTLGHRGIKPWEKWSKIHATATSSSSSSSVAAAADNAVAASVAAAAAAYAAATQQNYSLSFCEIFLSSTLSLSSSLSLSFCVWKVLFHTRPTDGAAASLSVLPTYCVTLAFGANLLSNPATLSLSTSHRKIPTSSNQNWPRYLLVQYLQAENTNLLCEAHHLFYLFGFSCFSYV